MEEAKHFIGNQWVAAASHETIPVIDPSDGQVFAQLARGNAADIDRAVQAARHAYEGPWGHASAADRGRVLYRLSMIIAAHQDELAHLEARDTGKPLKQAHADAAGIARYFGSTQAPPTSCMARPCRIKTATPSSPFANRTA